MKIRSNKSTMDLGIQSLLLHFHKQEASIRQVMGLVRTRNSSYLLVLFISFSCFEFRCAIDTITAHQFIKDPEIIISNGGDFKLGFFSPTNSTYRYVGIWYAKVSASHVVWVANRDRPLKTSSGILNISEDGNLVILDEEKKIIWSSNVTNSVSNPSAQLSDSGNLVLKENNTGSILWESFQHPSDSLLPKMKMITDTITGKNVQLTSWKRPSDPSVGAFFAGIYLFNLPEMFIWKDSKRHWRSGPWNSRIFIGIPTMYSVYLDGFSLVDDNEGTFYFTYDFSNNSMLSHYTLSSEGNIEEISSINGKDWGVTWSSLMSECDIYGKCGAFGSCNSQNSPICSCLEGFEPKNIQEWNGRNWSSGCVRRTPLQCKRVNSTGGEEGQKDGFLRVKMMKTPDFANWSSTIEDECRYQCLENCACIAYAYESGIGCMSWSSDLIDSQKFSTGGVDLYVRVAYSELDKKGELKVIITVTVVIGSVFIAICTFFLYQWMAKRKGGIYLKFHGEGNYLAVSMNKDKLEELPILSHEELGKLLDGQEIAVKRLARTSGQGLEEFMNEVVVISKLQHRNLVRLIGGCVEGEEKMLVYEYMPNKSLDTFLFDPVKRESLKWRERFNIIEGIGRGLLYLHRDSRLRIIHRDLKASNILLDEELNPKISDFGLAKIFGGDEDQANTKRVAGTYGYMSPEYAMEGRFSEKSDVFSFGVLLLEIVSGRRNASFYYNEQITSLLGFAWKMWETDNIAVLIDPVISEPCSKMEILRCIHVGLLCVQDFAKDRPSVHVAISMLKSEIIELPRPKQPVFTTIQVAPETECSNRIRIAGSVNNVTITTLYGR
ncbi:G-type lectin S-receptor-like serine/threonine-protein kinase At1g11330 isoform X2 [Carya illinoinensis]|uniref:G-type lectin S-receptor-like serine/threonine-protein kinase At1g11330 isoform X2 n=1 Tax=Carya illinoinensis TaxID=32201 RepID=UPI001C718222|nr:G-type lectin S-receptor-like serine/threonine-protein kinase At1g11330 isoform X2 [Carya illinoinensis]